MTSSSNRGNDKQQAHDLIERLTPSQVSAVIGLLEAMLDPAGRTIANAPFDDEAENDAEHRAVLDSKEWFSRDRGREISHEEVLSDFGLSPDDFKKPKA